MRSRSLAFLAVTLSFFGPSGCSNPPAAARVGTDQAAQITVIKGLFPTLAVGMTGKVVRQKLGPPAAIEPMEAPAGRAEVWVYHFEKTVGMTQVATSTRDIPALGVTGGGTVTVNTPELVYTPVEQKTLVTLRLLMFNDRLTAQKALVEDSTKYH